MRPRRRDSPTAGCTAPRGSRGAAGTAARCAERGDAGRRPARSAAAGPRDGAGPRPLAAPRRPHRGRAGAVAASRRGRAARRTGRPARRVLDRAQRAGPPPAARRQRRRRLRARRRHGRITPEQIAGRRIPRRLHRAAPVERPRRARHGISRRSTEQSKAAITQGRAHYWLGRAASGGWRRPETGIRGRGRLADNLLRPARRARAR